MQILTHLQKARRHYVPKLPAKLQALERLHAAILKRDKPLATEIASIFPNTANQPLLSFSIGETAQDRPLRVGVVFSGGQASGGHNVITGMYDALKKLNGASQLYGFKNGPSGIIECDFMELNEEMLALYRNQGGFDLIGSGRTKIETEEQFIAAARTAEELQLDGLVVIGGDDSNTNAALLAEYYLAQGLTTKVIGVPKTIDGDLKNEHVEVSFGFDTAAKTYSETIASILRDSLSAKKYYFFIKLMGRSASHIALECALQTHPNLTLIGEEVAEKNMTLKELTDQIADMIEARAEADRNYGVVLIPEGVIEFIPEFKTLIQELNRMPLDHLNTAADRIKEAKSRLRGTSLKCFESIPEDIQGQLLLDRDPHGNVQVSKIETERLFIASVKKELADRKKSGRYKGQFSAQPLFLGYEGRSCLPTNFDATYCYALGQVAALLINAGATGYMACVKNLASPAEQWELAGIPIADMIHMEERKGQRKPVIRKALVDLAGNPFKIFAEQRMFWAESDDFRYPGPIQFFGPVEITDAINLTLDYERRQLASTV